MKWHNKHFKEVCLALGTDEVNGLTENQAEESMYKYGENKLQEKEKTSIIIRFFMQFNDFMIMILLASAVVSAGLSVINKENDFIDSIIILFIVTLNAILGLVQENKAEKSLEALKKSTAPSSKVIRNGKLMQMDTSKVVVGDLIVLETGDFVPADARLVTSSNLKIEESALTGESLPVSKEASFISLDDSVVSDRRNMVYSGSSIGYGRGTAVVVAVGMDTEVGKIANMIMSEESKETPLQKKLAGTGKALGIGALVICFIIFLLGLLRHIPAFEMFMTSVSLAVAAIPEGLPAIVTVMLAIGVQRMVRRNAIVRKLPAVETLGGATVICSDKTGTLTQNKMTVIEICDSIGQVNNSGSEKLQILKLLNLCNNTTLVVEDGETKLIGEPTEKALITAGLNAGLSKNKLMLEYPRIEDIPFDSKRKMMTTLHKDGEGKYFSVTKGALDVLLKKCTHYYEKGKVLQLTSSKASEIEKMNENMASKALRVLAVAYRDFSEKPYKLDEEKTECNLIFMGVVGMMDPPREEAKGAVETCIKAGIKPVMVTGDHAITALAIAKKLGICEGGKALTGYELNNMSDEELEKRIYDYSVFARVSPEHKVKIVKAFQNNGAVVAMTGDGVNDAPALKVADIGCAMGISGTDVAKGASDMILTDDNFKTIVDAVREGRGIYNNIKKAVHFLLSSNIGEIITILAALLMGFPTPLLAIHLLWVNLVTDSLPAIALGLDPADKDIMEKRQQGNNGKSLFSRNLWNRIALEGIMIGMLALIAFGVGIVYFDDYGDVSIGRTMAFATLSISQLVHAFNMRSEGSIFKLDILENIYLVYAFVIGIILQVSVIMIDPLAEIFKVSNLSSSAWLVVAFLCIMPLAIVELQKLVTSILYIRFSRTNKKSYIR